MKLCLAVIAICCAMACAGCKKQAPLETPPVEPTGKLVWTQTTSGETSVDLAGTYSGTKEQFAGSVANEDNGQYLGKLEWEFIPNTKRFGNIILVRMELPNIKTSEHVLRDGAFAVLYEDTNHKIEYMKK